MLGIRHRDPICVNRGRVTERQRRPMSVLTDGDLNHCAAVNAAMCQKAASHLWFETKRGRLVGDLFDPNLMKGSYLKPIGNASFNNIHV